MDLWVFWNHINGYCQKFHVNIVITAYGKDLMKIDIYELPSHTLNYREQTTWCYTREDEYVFMDRLEQQLSKFAVNAVEWRSKLNVTRREVHLVEE